jgi:hypothetical protein
LKNVDLAFLLDGIAGLPRCAFQSRFPMADAVRAIDLLIVEHTAGVGVDAILHLHAALRTIIEERWT